MAWGAKKKGVEDLVALLASDKAPTTIAVLPMRQFNSSEATSLAKALAVNSTVTELLASGHTIGDEGAQAIAEMLKTNTTLKKLNVGSCTMGDSGLQALVDGICLNSTLTSLDLEYKGCKEGRGVQKILESTQSVTELSLSRNEWSSDGVGLISLGLKECSSLRSLEMRECGVAEEGARNLGAALASHRSLTSLDLSSNPLSDAGAALLINAVASSPVTTLTLKDCGLGTDSIGALSQWLGTADCMLSALDLQQNNLGSECVERLARDGLQHNRFLKRLCLSNTGAGDNGAIALAQALAAGNSNCQLASLDVGNCGISWTGASALLPTPLLRNLGLFGNNLGDDVSPAVDSLTGMSIELLDVGASGMSGCGITAVLQAIREGAHQLKTLIVGGNDIDEEANAAIKSAQEQLPQLDIAFRTKASG
ncbi:unnamed protein product [Chrysoparadoxa australica]